MKYLVEVYETAVGCNTTFYPQDSRGYEGEGKPAAEATTLYPSLHLH